MAIKVKIECPGCGKEMSLDLARKHKLHRELCMTQHWYAAFHDDDQYTIARGHWRILELAGLTKMWPIGAPRYMDAETHDWIPALNMVHVTPKWAYALAERLQNDHDLAVKLGTFELQQRAAGKTIDTRTKKIVPVRKTVKVISMWLRLRILRSCARSAVAREMSIDDAETVAILLRDS